MFACPHCTKRLSHATTAGGPAWPCSSCGGVAFPMATLRKTRMPAATVAGLFEKAKTGEGIRGRFCPICANWMCGLPVPVENDSVTIDVCAGCQLFWFDPKEFERVLPKPETTPPPGLPPAQPAPTPARTAEARPPVPLAPLDYENEIKMRWWNYLSGFLGMPIEIQSPKRKRKPKPSATATLAAIIAGGACPSTRCFPELPFGSGSVWSSRSGFLVLPF